MRMRSRSDWGKNFSHSSLKASGAERGWYAARCARMYSATHCVKATTSGSDKVGCGRSPSGFIPSKTLLQIPPVRPHAHFHSQRDLELMHLFHALGDEPLHS